MKNTRRAGAQDLRLLVDLGMSLLPTPPKTLSLLLLNPSLLPAQSLPPSPNRALRPRQRRG